MPRYAAGAAIRTHTKHANRVSNKVAMLVVLRAATPPTEVRSKNGGTT
jgi:hypothetical protein